MHIFTNSILSFLFLTSCLLSASVAQSTDWPGDNRDNPNRPDAVGTFMANGIFDPADPDYIPPTAQDFDIVIMGRDADQAEARRQKAVDYFLERFGVDFNDFDFAQGGAIVLLRSYNDPRWNYRCYKLPNRRVPASGLIVHDAQYVMAVVAPEATLYGSWGGEAGTPVAGGTVAVDGEYLIQGTNQFRHAHPRNIHIHFNSVTPIFDAALGNIKFDCRLASDDFGSGAAQGRQEFYLLENGRTQIAINNVLQFAAPQWASEQD